MLTCDAQRIFFFLVGGAELGMDAKDKTMLTVTGETLVLFY